MKLKLLPPRAELTLPDGSRVEVERIGKGRYTTAWRNCTTVYLQTNQKDYGKEIVTRLAEAPRNPHIPDCARLDDADPWQWYRMPLYAPLTAKSGAAWEHFKVLRSLWEDARKSIRYDARRTDDQEVYLLNSTFADLADDATYLPNSLKQAVRQLTDECANYGTYTFEISKRNCAVDGAGNLILLDAVFDLVEVRSQWRQKPKATY